MVEGREEGVSLGEIGRAVAKKIWIVLGAAVLFTLIAALVCGLAVNPAATDYSMVFRIVYPTSAEQKYPDGSPFYYYSMVSADSLAEAKASDTSFAQLDVQKMLKKDEISTRENTNEEGDVISYTMSVRSSYFTGKEQAESFLRAAASVPVSRIKKNAQSVDYGIDKEVFAGASFEEQMKILKEQRETLLGVYDSWMEVYSPAYAVEGKTLEKYKTALYSVYGESTQSTLEAEFETNGYDSLDLNSYDSIEEAIAARKKSLDSEYDLNQKIIQAIRTALSDMQTPRAAVYSKTESGQEEKPVSVIINQSSKEDLSQMLARYVSRNEQIDYQRKTTLTAENVQSFANRLGKQFDALEQEADTLTKITSSVYAQNTAVIFLTQTADASGGINLVLVSVVAFVFAFIVAAIVTAAIGIPKERKKKAKSATEE